MVRFFTIFRAKKNPVHAMWVTHGMMHACHVDGTWHGACMPCGGVQPIKKGIDGEREENERERGKGRKIWQLLPLIFNVMTVEVIWVES